MDYDVVIIGAGVVGLAIGMVQSEKGKRCLILEKNKGFGEESSSRNSEVIHAGIYYPKGSLKAKLCVEGNSDLYNWCEIYNVPFCKTGKYIVAVNEEDLDNMYQIFERGNLNGARNLEIVSSKLLNQKEPNVNCKEAIWSPSSGIVDSHKLMVSFKNAAEEYGCDVVMNHKCISINKVNSYYEILVLDSSNEEFRVTAPVVINSAGLNADKVAESAGIDLDANSYRMNLCKGHYFRISPSKSKLVSHLIYPVPPKNHSGLGIHVTLDLNNQLKLGPDAVFLSNKEKNYDVSEELQPKFFKAASSYLKGLEFSDLYPDYSGIRPKLQKEGEAPKDFIIINEENKDLPNLINLIGIESPGLTSCLSIAKYVDSLILS